MPTAKPQRRHADSYEHHDDITHVLHRPDTYAGSTRVVDTEVEILTGEPRHVERVKMPTCMAIDRMYFEILSNAVDCVVETRGYADGAPAKDALAKSRAPPVTVKITGTRITVRNAGEPMPLTPHPTSKPDKLVLVPWLVFGNFRSSGKYDDSVDREGVGRNGLGAKIVNVFSTRFEVRVGDPHHGQEYEGVWTNNMRTLEKSEARPGYAFDGEWKTRSDADAKRGAKKAYSGPAYVEVSYDLDFSRFAGFGDAYSENAIRHFAKIAFDYSFSAKVAISFETPSGTELIDGRNIKSYISTLFPASEEDDPASRAVVHYEWETPADARAASRVSGGAAGIAKAIAAGQLKQARAEIVVVDTPDSARDFGFVNGLSVPFGTHVNEAAARVCNAIIAASPVAATTAKGGVAKVRPGDVRPHFSLIVNCRVTRPDFESQTKQTLSSWVSFPGICAEEFRNAMTSSSDKNRWLLGERLAEAVDVKERRAVAKTDGKKKKRIDVKGLIDANFAGGPRSSECTLFITEGQSAAIYATKRIDCLPGKRDRFGVFAIRGKFINVTSASTKMLLANAEYSALKLTLGLSEGADYSSETAARGLRYGRVCILADADEDGSAIRSLLINCFSQRWPSLVKTGRIGYLATPAIRITAAKDGAIVRRFFTDSAYYAWESTPQGRATMTRAGRCHVRHIKGLSTSSNADIRDDVSTAPTLHVVFDDSASETLDLAFSEKRADDRKQWIAEWRRAFDAGTIKSIELEALSERSAAKKEAPTTTRTVASIINQDLAEYSYGALRRSIPSALDGLKHSQRQAIWCALRTWGFGVGAASKEKSIKVSRFAARVAEEVSYAHGEVSMQECIVSLAQGFPGTNNLPVFFPDGQFGSRAGGPKVHGAPRYIYTKLGWAAKHLYTREAVELIPREKVEGELAESKWIPTDVSLSVINGARGIGTGWSTTIPCHHPVETVQWYLDRISGATPKEPSIWFAGSSAENEVVGGVVKTARSPAVEVVDDDASGESVVGARRLVSRGRYRATERSDGKYDVVVEELPVGVWTNNYAEWLNSLVVAGRLGDFRDLSTATQPRFELTGFSLEEPETKVAKTAPKTAKPAPKRRAKPATELNAKALELEKIAYSLTNFVLLGEDGNPKKYSRVSEILEEHFARMSGVYADLKAHYIASTEAALKKASDRFALIDAIVKRRVVVFERPEKDVLADLRKLNLSVDEFALLKIRDATADELDRLRALIRDLEAKLAELKAKPHLQFWSERLEKFREELVRRIAESRLDGSDD